MVCSEITSNTAIPAGDVILTSSIKPESLFLSNYSAKSLLVFMQKHTTLNINYEIVCENTSQTFYLRIKSSSSIIEVDDSFILLCSNSTESDDPDGIFPATLNGSVSVDVFGGLVGFSRLELTTCVSGPDNPELCITSPWTQFLPVSVMKTMRVVDIVFRYVIGVAIIVINIAFGCKLDLGIVKECVKRPIALAIGFLCQYLLMPLVSTRVA